MNEDDDLTTFPDAITAVDDVRKRLLFGALAESHQRQPTEQHLLAALAYLELAKVHLALGAAEAK